MKSMLRPLLTLFIGLSLICGVLYPYCIALIGQTIFPYQANGSLLSKHDRLIGSTLIGQMFSSPQYFWGRPSATTPMGNNALSSGGSNFGPSNPALIDAIKSRVQALKALDPKNTMPIPVDLVTASASGLDPEVSVAAAYYQAARIARQRKVSQEKIRHLIAQYTLPKYLDFFGEARVNVLQLNLALDQMQQ